MLSPPFKGSFQLINFNGCGSPFRQTAPTYDLVCLNTVDRVVATDSRDPWFESKFYCLNWPLFKGAIGGSKTSPKPLIELVIIYLNFSPKFPVFLALEAAHLLI